MTPPGWGDTLNSGRVSVGRQVPAVFCVTGPRWIALQLVPSPQAEMETQAWCRCARCPELPSCWHTSPQCLELPCRRAAQICCL